MNASQISKIIEGKDSLVSKFDFLSVVTLHHPRVFVIHSKFQSKRPLVGVSADNGCMLLLQGPAGGG